MKKLTIDKKLGVASLLIGLAVGVFMGFWLFTHPASVVGASILGVAFLVVFGVLLFLMAEAVRAHISRGKKHEG